MCKMETNKIKELLKELTLEEKVSLLSGVGAWHTKGIERLGIPEIMMSDGPHGLRKCSPDKELGWEFSYPATCFPTASLLACSWDAKLAEKQGIAIGEEAQDQDLQIVLGPGNNMKRSPLCGRNFEYFSEDPYLSGRLAAGIIDGIQSQNVGTSLKHFCANNQESDRLTVDEIIDERTLREIYLASYEYPVKNARPTTLMCAYNKVNGDYCSQSKWLLTDILRDEWGFEGLVMSDWGAVNNRPQGVYAGLDLEMPGSDGVNEAEIIKAVNDKKVVFDSVDPNFDNKLSIEEIDICAERVLKLVFDLHEKKNGKKCDYEKHHQVAADIAKECMVLLKNDGILPLKKGAKIALLGEMAVNPRFQGSGSSRVSAYKVTNALEAIKNYADVEYSQGYSLENDKDMSMIDSAVEAAKKSEIAIIIAGLPDNYESEGYDRAHLAIPPSHIKLIETVKAVQPNIVVVLCNGAPVEMPFIDSANAILEAYLGGQASGIAVADILFGTVNPCGKLAETFPICLENNPSYENFPGKDRYVEYREGLFNGYRYYSSKKIPVLFPFGHGLSYTTFSYSNLAVSCDKAAAVATVTVDVTNTGAMAGKEIVQLYLTQEKCDFVRPIIELKGFTKLSLDPGETKTAEFKLDKRDFSYWSDVAHDWKCDGGKFIVSIGASSEDIRLKGEILLDEATKEIEPITICSSFMDLRRHPNGQKLAVEIANKMGFKLTEITEKTDVNSLDWFLLKTLITMGGLKMSLQEMVDKIAEVNEKTS